MWLADGLLAPLVVEEVRPRKSRFYLRNAVGMFSDLQGDPEMSAEGSKELRQILGSALYVSLTDAHRRSPKGMLTPYRAQFDDAIHSAQLSKHPLIPTSDLDLFFASTGLNEPDFSQKHLSQLLEETLAPPRPQGQVVHGGAGGSQGPAQEEKVTEKQLQKALDVTGVWVCYLQRSFARLTTGLSSA